MRRRRGFTLKAGGTMRSRIVLLGTLTLLLSWAGQARAQEFKLIVNVANTGSQIRKELVQAIFLKGGLRWTDGKGVVAVDQSTRAPVRAAFSEQMLGMNIPTVQQYWMHALQAGRVVPPSVKASDEEVVAFVSGNPGAIGYVSAASELGAGVKLLKVID
jgi:ABC-type phosphate transport system substrate-binding protein